MTVEITMRRARPPGGQHVGCEPYILCARHVETGVYIEIPPGLFRSQHLTRLTALEALEYITGETP